jgi:hypothetical protein
MSYHTREQWLMKALDITQQHLIECRAIVAFPEKVKVSCGLAGGRIGAKRIGECWSHTASTGGMTEIFISPVLDAPLVVLATLVHEAIHAALGNEVGHRAPFKAAATLAGLTGKMTATLATDELNTIMSTWLNILGMRLYRADHV